MKTSQILLAFAVAASLALSACGGGGGGSSAIPTNPQQKLPAPGLGGGANGNTSSIPAALQFAWQSNLLAHATVVGSVDPRSTISMKITVKMQNPTGLLSYAQQVSEPNSGAYRHFLTPSQIATQFGATAANYQAAAAYLQGYGLHVTGWPQREVLVATGAIGNFSRAFSTTFAMYHSGNQTFVGPSGTPHLTSAAPIGSVYGLVHAMLAHQYFMGVPAGQSFVGYSPQQLQRAFDFSGPAESDGINGSGIDVAIVGTGPISPSDAQLLSQIYNNAPMGAITQMPVTDTGVTFGLTLNSPSPNPGATGVTYPYSSGFQTPPPVTAPCSGSLPTCNPEDIEAQLDSETVASLAPGSNVLFYLAYNPNDCWQNSPTPQENTVCPAGQGEPGIGIYEDDPEIQQIIADDTADVVTMSYGGGELFDELGGPLGNTTGYFDSSGNGFGPIEFATMVSEGMAVFASSGDTGAYECSEDEYFEQTLIPGNPMCVSYPADDPSVIGVGGLTGPLNATGQVTTQFTAWGYQTTGGGDGTFGNNIGSGGGISTVFPATPWQAAASSPVGGSMRTNPDISMMADPNTGPSVVANAAFPAYTELLGEGGTSVASPQMAAMWSLVLQACKQDAVCGSRSTGPHPYRLGNPGPLMYGMYKTSAYGSAIFDVQYGNNGAYGPVIYPSPSSTAAPTPGAFGAGYSAGVGYDLVTGLGVPMGGRFIDAVLTEEGSTNPVSLP